MDARLPTLLLIFRILSIRNINYYEGIILRYFYNAANSEPPLTAGVATCGKWYPVTRFELAPLFSPDLYPTKQHK
jgi:hypothetical protein